MNESIVSRQNAQEPQQTAACHQPFSTRVRAQRGENAQAGKYRAKSENARTTADVQPGSEMKARVLDKRAKTVRNVLCPANGPFEKAKSESTPSLKNHAKARNHNTPGTPGVQRTINHAKESKKFADRTRNAAHACMPPQTEPVKEGSYPAFCERRAYVRLRGRQLDTAARGML